MLGGFKENATMRRIFTILIATVFHKRTPVSAKLLLGAGALYGLFPIDAIPDLLPVIGEMDDLTVIIIAVTYFWWKTRRVREELRTNQAHTTPLE